MVREASFSPLGVQAPILHGSNPDDTNSPNGNSAAASPGVRRLRGVRKVFHKQIRSWRTRCPTQGFRKRVLAIPLLGFILIATALFLLFDAKNGSATLQSMGALAASQQKATRNFFSIARGSRTPMELVFVDTEISEDSDDGTRWNGRKILNKVYLNADGEVKSEHESSGSILKVVIESRSGTVLFSGSSDFTLPQRHASVFAEDVHLAADPLIDLIPEAPAKTLEEALSRKVVPNAPLPGVDASKLHGRLGLGLDGKPLWTPRPMPFRQTQEQRVRSHEGYCFNTRMSQSLSLDRSVPDYNSARCKAVQYDYATLPKATVIIIFHNEDLSVLLRSVHSVLNKTPPKLLAELILVDDLSNHTSHPWLGSDLDFYVAHLPKVALMRLTERAGLMMARVRGTEWATGEVVVFLDSHIECSDRWIEPLLQRIKENPKNMVVPLIHTIGTENFAFEKGFLSTLSFSWSLGQTHPPHSNNDFDPMPSPVMAGGLFATNLAWFNALGGYDDEMRLYGGEEMEIGFKTWMCGGRLDALPCSRVGHVFRTGKYWPHQVYKVPGEEIQRNKLRVAAIWMDEYAKIVKGIIPKLPPNLPLGSIEKMQNIRKKLNCKSFDWYLKNVVVDYNVPSLDGGHVGAIRNTATNVCVDALAAKDSGDEVGAYPCHGQHGTQTILFGSDGHLRVAQTNYLLCIRPGRPGVRGWLNSARQALSNTGSVVSMYVTDDCGTARWKYDDATKQLIYDGADAAVDRHCLTMLTRDNQFTHYTLTVEPCDTENERQAFIFDEIDLND